MLHFLRSQILVRLGVLLLSCLAVGGATGWLQGAAWTGMVVAKLAANQTLSSAISLTLDGSSPCGLCESISQQKEQDRKDSPFFAQNKLIKEVPVSGDIRWIFARSKEFVLIGATPIEMEPVFIAPETPPPKSSRV